MRQRLGFRGLIVILLIIAVVGTGLYLSVTRIFSRTVGPQRTPSSPSTSGYSQPAASKFKPWLDEAPPFSATVYRGSKVEFPDDYANRWVWLLFASKG